MFDIHTFMLQAVNILIIIFGVMAPIWLIYKINSIDKSLKKIAEAIEEPKHNL